MIVLYNEINNNPVDVSLSNAAPEEREWYARLSERLDTGYTPHKAMNYHRVMYHGRTVAKSIRQIFSGITRHALEAFCSA